MKLILSTLLLSTSLQFTAQNYIQTNIYASNLNNVANNPVQSTSNMRQSLSNVAIYIPDNNSQSRSRGSRNVNNPRNQDTQTNGIEIQTQSANRGAVRNEQSQLRSRGNEFNLNVTWNIKDTDNNEQTNRVQSKVEVAPRKEISLGSISLPQIKLPSLELNKTIKTNSDTKITSINTKSSLSTFKLVLKSLQKKLARVKSYFRKLFRKKTKSRFSVNCFLF